MVSVVRNAMQHVLLLQLPCTHLNPRWLERPERFCGSNREPDHTLCLFKVLGVEI